MIIVDKFVNPFTRETVSIILFEKHYIGSLFLDYYGILALATGCSKPQAKERFFAYVYGSL